MFSTRNLIIVFLRFCVICSNNKIKKLIIKTIENKQVTRYSRRFDPSMRMFTFVRIFPSDLMKGGRDVGNLGWDSVWIIIQFPVNNLNTETFMYNWLTSAASPAWNMTYWLFHFVLLKCKLNNVRNGFEKQKSSQLLKKKSYSCYYFLFSFCSSHMAKKCTILSDG